MTSSLPNFDFSSAWSAASQVPMQIVNEIPSAIYFGGVDVASTMFHGWLVGMGYTGVLSLALANGLGDTAKFAYYSASGNAFPSKRQP
jgi:hypothetical protein